jgi:hypothetical protein
VTAFGLRHSDINRPRRLAPGLQAQRLEVAPGSKHRLEGVGRGEERRLAFLSAVDAGVDSLGDERAE